MRNRFKFLTALITAALLVLVGGQANAAPAGPGCSVVVDFKTEVLTVNHGDYWGSMVIEYTLGPVLTNPSCAGSHLGHRFIDITSMTWTTEYAYQADILKVTYEKTPGNYVTVVHFGGDGVPQNTVSSGWNGGARDRIWITNPTDSPAWGLYNKGFENSTTNTDTDYGVI